jgi:hypothetical protein
MPVSLGRALAAIALGFLTAGCAASATVVGPGGAAGPQGQSTISRWLSNAAPAAWDAADDRIVIDRRGADGLWDAYTVRPDGRGVRCITCGRPSFPGVEAATNRGAGDVSPDGRYVLLTVEKGAHPGAVGGLGTDPGKGLYNDVWLSTTDGSRTWPLTDLTVAGVSGVIWPRFDRTGSQIVWSQLYAPADLGHPLGQWALKTARLAWSGGVPRLVAVRTYDPQPGRFFEPYGFSAGDRRILFASDETVPSGFLAPSAANTQIWTIDAARLNDLRRVDPPARIDGPFSDYNEFAYYLPHSDRVLFARTVGATARGMDYWTVGPDAGDPRRLTFMNEPGDAQYEGYTVAGGVAFDPRDPRRFVAGVSHDPLGNSVQAVFVTIGG